MKALDAAGERIRDDQRNAGGHRAAHLPGIRLGHEPARDCARAERGRRSRPQGEALERQHAARAREGGHRGAQQRTLYRPSGVEPVSRDEGPGDGQAGDAAQPGGRLDRGRGSRASHRGRRTVAGGEGPAGGTGGAICDGARGRSSGEREPAERHPPAPPPALGPTRMRPVRGTVCDAGPGPLFLFEPCHDGWVHEPQEHPAPGSGGAGAHRPQGPADGAGGGRGGDAGLWGGDQPAQPRAPCLGGGRPQGTRRHREEDRLDDRGHRGRRLRAGHVGPAARA